MRILPSGELSGDYDTDCPMTRAVLDRVGDKWSVLVVVLLGDRTMRFNALKRAARGISQRILTATLRNLERDGIVARAVRPTKPPQVDYTLTSLGRTFLGPVAVVARWAEQHRAAVERARDDFDRGAARGSPRARAST